MKIDIPYEHQRQSGIYSITNNLNGKKYIGSAVCLKRRYDHHTSDLKKGTHANNKLQRAINKTGFLNFTFSLIEICKPDQLIKAEQKWINQLKSVTTGYNINPTAGSALGYKHTPENIKQRNETRRAKGWIISDQQKEKMSNILRGRKFSPETIERMKAAAKNRMTEEMRARISETKKGKTGPNKGRVFNQQARTNMSIAAKNRKTKTA